MNNVIFRDKDHAWVIVPVKFDYSVTIPIPRIRIEYNSSYEFSALEIDKVLSMNPDNKHDKFYEILEIAKTMNVFYDLIHLYIMGSMHISSQNFPRNEVKAIKTLKTWITLANKLHKLLSIKDKVEITDKLIMKIARETKPTLFKMPEGSKYYDDSKSEIVFLSPYEDNTKALKTKNTAKNMIWGKNKIKHFIKGELIPFSVGF